MQLPKVLTTVTPFSKYIAMFLFIIFPFLGFYLGIQYQKSTTITPQPLYSSNHSATFPPSTQTVTNSLSWKTYADLNNVFTIQHPGSYFETPSGSNQSALQVLGWKDAGVLSTVSPWNKPLGNGDMRVQFTIEPKQTNETLEAFITRTVNQKSGEFAQGAIMPDVKKTITVDGRSALWYQGNLGPAVKHTEIFIPKDDTCVVVITAYTGEALITGGNGAMTLSDAHKGLLIMDPGIWTEV